VPPSPATIQGFANPGFPSARETGSSSAALIARGDCRYGLRQAARRRGERNGVQPMVKYLHSMIRVSDPEATAAFFELIGLKEVRRFDNEGGRFTLIFLAAPGQEGIAEVELTYNWPPEDGSAPEVYSRGRNFGHLAYRVDDIYAACQRLLEAGHTIHRPPRDGHMAFVKSPDGISVELLQNGNLPPQEPWASMQNTGSW
jgi:lactoylglutathione lyase